MHETLSARPNLLVARFRLTLLRTCLAYRLRNMELIMSRIALQIAFVLGMSVPAFAQKAEIEAANAKWIEFFNKGDFAGVASLYTSDATAFPPGSAMVQGGAAIGAMWKSMAEKVGDPKLPT